MVKMVRASPGQLEGIRSRVNGDRAFADGTGVGESWSAYFIVNLSVCAGVHHPAPEPGVTDMSFRVEWLHVHRP